MSPQSLLYTPVELLQSTPGRAAAGAEGARRAALVVLGGTLLVALVVALIALTGAPRPACPDAAAADGARTCEPAAH